MFIVIEFQKGQDGQISSLVSTHDTLQEAESKFHQVLSYAAVSTLPLHSCMILNDKTYVVKTQVYTHTVGE